MPELSVRFTSDEKQPDSPIQVYLFRPDTGADTKPAPFTPPLDDIDLDEIHWYLEAYFEWPTEVDRARAARIEEKLETWGSALTESVIQQTGGETLLAEFLKDASDEKRITIDATDPRVLRLPWELMTDGKRHLFARGVSIRRRLQDSAPMPTRQFELPLRILDVVARPDDSGFISPRAFSKPMLDSLESLGVMVEVEFLYPPTLAALSERLQDRAQPRVHVVHFDGHGVYNEKTGLGYLAFERDDHNTDLIGSDQIGTLLVGTGIPLAVLNACQSAAQEKTNPYASVAASLVQAGVGNVLAMNYSVLVSAAEIFVHAFYKNLAAGLSVGVATDQARRALLAKQLRHTFYRRDEKGNEVKWPFELRDWFLPALYQQAADPVIFADGDGAVVPRREPAAFTNARLPGALPPEPLHGFTGRARELLKLERELAARAVVIVHGFGGLGKTTLAAEAARWFWRTGRFPGGAAFVSFEHGGSLDQLCSWVGQAVSGDPNWQIGEGGDPVTRVAELLARQPALVILDNFESVIGNDPIMPQEELAAVLDAVWTWAQAGLKAGMKGSRVLITTRDTHLNDPRYAPGKHCAHLPLGGLAPQDALELAGNILDNHGIDRERVSRDDLKALIAHLGGHTLSLYLVLPQLKTYTARQIIDDFETLLPGFVMGKASERNESLKVSLEFSLRRLGEATRAALPALAVFQGGALEALILDITEIDPDLWKSARAELEAAALVTVENIAGVTTPFLQFHPTLLPALGEALPAERRTALETRFWQEYYEFSTYLYNSDTKTPHQARAMALVEMPNLRRAFDLALDAALRGATEAHTAIDFAGKLSRFLGDIFGRRRELEALRRELERLPQTDGALTKADILRLIDQGEALRNSGRLAEAEKIFRDLLERLESEANFDATYERGMTMWLLGRCLRFQNRKGEALGCFREAESIFRELGASSTTAKESQAKCLTEIGNVLAESGHFDEAQAAYEGGLEISRELEDHRSIGVKLSQLGSMALRQNDLRTARERFQEAFRTFSALGEPSSEANAWHGLGMAAELAKDWGEAERCYREAVRIYEGIDDKKQLSAILHQLGNVAKYAGRLADAERWFLQAQAIFDKVAPQNTATLGNLAALYFDLGRLEEARTYAERAVRIVEKQDIDGETWKRYSTLADISAREEKFDEARGWRRKANAARDAFAGTRYELAPILARFAGVIEAAAAACVRNAEARAQVEGRFEGFAKGNWQIAEPIRRIWAGERDAEALTEDIDYNSRAIVLAILHRLGVAVPEIIPESLAMAQTSVSPQQREKLAQVLGQFRSVIDGVAAAANGNEAIKPQIEGLFEQFTEDGWQIAEPIRRIWVGERDPQVLTQGIDGNSAAIVFAILHRLGVDVPPFIRELLDGSAGGQSGGGGQGQGITIEQLIDLVGAVVGGTAPQGLGQQLFDLTQKLAVDPQAPPEVRVLANALHGVLAGKRTPDLAGLSEDLKRRVQGMLDTLK